MFQRSTMPAALSRSIARPHAPCLTVRRRAPRAGASPRPTVRVPSGGSTPSQAAPARRRIEVPAPYRGQSHSRAHQSVHCRPVRDAYIQWRPAFSSRVCASSTSPCPVTGRPANPARAGRRRHWRQPRRTQGLADRITPLRRPPPSSACSPFRSPFPPCSHLAGAVAPAAGTGQRCGTPPSGAPPLQLQPQTGPW
jgi:hypothetical protein